MSEMPSNRTLLILCLWAACLTVSQGCRPEPPAEKAWGIRIPGERETVLAKGEDGYIACVTSLRLYGEEAGSFSIADSKGLILCGPVYFSGPKKHQMGVVSMNFGCEKAGWLHAEPGRGITLTATTDVRGYILGVQIPAESRKEK